MFLSDKLVSRHSILGHWIIGRNNQMMEIVSPYSSFPTNAIDNINTRTHARTHTQSRVKNKTKTNAVLTWPGWLCSSRLWIICLAFSRGRESDSQDETTGAQPAEPIGFSSCGPHYSIKYFQNSIFLGPCFSFRFHHNYSTHAPNVHLAGKLDGFFKIVPSLLTLLPIQLQQSLYTGPTSSIPESVILHFEVLL